MKTYDQVISGKARGIENAGFDVDLSTLNPNAWTWQKLIIAECIRRGRAAIFADCGLGKTLMQLDWAKQICERAGGPVLILCPLAVAQQTVAEGRKFGIDVKHCRESADFTPGINITNYERLWKMPFSDLAGVVLDESSILKSFTGVMRRRLTESCSGIRYRLCCTATPAPNDFTELGQHAEFLGAGSAGQMLATYFINDTYDTGTWRLKGHAEDAFWEWVSSWGVCISSPSDLGGDTAGFDLAPVETYLIKVAVDHKADPESGELFRNPNGSATSLHQENRRTIDARVEAAARIVNESDQPFIVWCELNDESGALTRAIPGSVEVVGSMEPEMKEDLLGRFTRGEARVIVTKPRIAGFGLNWQHCNREIYVGLSHSFEKFYQAGKRIHRYGQKRTVHRYIIQTDLESSVLDALSRKATQHHQLRTLTKFTTENIMHRDPMNHSPINKVVSWRESKTWRLAHGDCVRAAMDIPSESIGFSIFSPPFADLFTYSADVQDMGNCEDLDQFFVQFNFIVDALMRVTMPGRECAVHCCDLLATKWKDGQIEFKDFSGEIVHAFRKSGWQFHSRITIWKSPVTEMQRTKAHGLLYKTLRKDSSQSRVGAADYLLVFRKPGTNPKPITHSEDDFPLSLWQEIASPVWWTVDQGRVLNAAIARADRDERHICPLQLDVIERALKLWSADGDTIFSPFAGIGSEGYCALRAGRRFVGADLKESYVSTCIANLERAVQENASDLFTPNESGK